MRSTWRGTTAVALAAISAVALSAAPASAQQPTPWQYTFQGAATPVMESINEFHTFLMVIVTVITLFVMALLGWCIYRYNEKANPVPSKTSHHTMLEVVWTVAPVLILVVIAIPSFRLLYYQLDIPEADLTIKTTGQTWYWDYEYPDYEGVAFSANMVPEEELQGGQPRLLAADNAVVVPVNKTVKVLVTADPMGVIHAWAMPAFGVKIDAVPGRMNETWFRAEREGVYYGQCSELCGVNHAFMPIELHVVSEEEFEQWISQQQTASRSLPEDVKLAELASEAQ
ncbi:cytochrome c oxidase subunit II [Lutibaculum baratangense]|uniref:Cytochrome c oxidase subunit 2 n=1 Tax=Lutibaculum baratangense AMV1 TaxID=631454 RepID=V4RP37_9HYPH|nr:cytochrome c oxidase subunit II [Lutibaculum baratangense]ESR24940.1 Cytochrome c oxidase polypeptide II [Lutibaculum baratangense AMV1]